MSLASPREGAPAECDVLVLGAGAAGMTAAITARIHGLRVVVIEKEALFGGTTAFSGGGIWIPCSPHATRARIPDSLEAAKQYIRVETGDCFDEKRVDVYLANGPEMIRFVEERTPVRFAVAPDFPDYHPDRPGAVAGGRTLRVLPWDARHLGAHLAYLRPPIKEMTLFGLMTVSGDELSHFLYASRSLKSTALIAKRLVSHLGDYLRHGRGMRLTNGNALAAGLAKALVDLDVPILRSAKTRELVRENGRVVGARVEHGGATTQVRASRGVILACGGFSQDPARRAQHFPHASNGGRGHWSPVCPGNSGDGVQLAEAMGGVLQSRVTNVAAWTPVSVVPGGRPGIFPHFIDRGKPGYLAVAHTGERFVNESSSYHDFVQAMFKACAGRPEASAFLICDHKAIRQYGIGFVKPSPFPLGPHLRSGYLMSGATPEALARRLAVDPARFAETLRRYNEGARAGQDPAFGRGSSAYNRYTGDPNHAPNPCIGPLDQPPYYAVKLVVGDLGTFAGLATDEHARVLDRSGAPIAGLYAAGNDMLSVLGGAYPGAGSTLGPAMTFGYTAARHLAAH